jgi:hypothetical protein
MQNPNPTHSSFVRTLALSSLEDAESGQSELNARLELRKIMLADLKRCVESRVALETAVQVLRRQNDSVRNETSQILLNRLPKEKESIAALIISKAAVMADLDRSKLAFIVAEKELTEATTATKLADEKCSLLAKQCGEINTKILSLQSSVALLRSGQRESSHQVSVLTDELGRLKTALPSLIARNTAISIEVETVEGKKQSIEQSLTLVRQQLVDAKQLEANLLARITQAQSNISRDEEALRIATTSTLTTTSATKMLQTRCEEIEEEEYRLSLWKTTTNTVSHSAVGHSEVVNSAVGHSAVGHSTVGHSTVAHSTIGHSAKAHSVVETHSQSGGGDGGGNKKRKLTLERPSTPAGGGEDSCAKETSPTLIETLIEKFSSPEVSISDQRLIKAKITTVAVLDQKRSNKVTTLTTPPHAPKPLSDIDNIFGDDLWSGK